MNERVIGPLCWPGWTSRNRLRADIVAARSGREQGKRMAQGNRAVRLQVCSSGNATPFGGMTLSNFYVAALCLRRQPRNPTKKPRRRSDGGEGVNCQHHHSMPSICVPAGHTNQRSIQNRNSLSVHMYSPYFV
jgi:hypothetical protein